MKVVVMVKATKESEAGVMPSEQLLADMTKFNEELVNAGIMLMGEGLHPTSKAKRIRFSGKDRTVMDGPFAETKELVAGFWIWNVKSMDEAVEWVKKCPNPMMEDSDIDIRPIFSMEDFGDALTPELQEREAQLIAATERLAKLTPRYEQAQELIVAGLNRRYTMETRGAIPEQWYRFGPQIEKAPGKTGTAAYGVCWNFANDGSCDFDYLCAVEVSDSATLPAEFTKLKIPASRYAVFTHHEHVSKLSETLEIIWKKVIPNSGLKPASAPCFERYSDEFNPETGVGGIEVWVPITA